VLQIMRMEEPMKRYAVLVIPFAILAHAPVAAADATASVDVSVEAAPEVTTADPEEVSAPTEPPEPVYEERLDVPGPGYAWVGGYWGWTGADWAWYPGRWLMAPEGRVYIEPYYERVGPNVVYVRGYWGPHDAPYRSYGGDRIRFAAPIRPVDYRRGEPPRVARSAGARPGSRPITAYAHATGAVRPLPRTTVPAYRASTHAAPPVAERTTVRSDAKPQGEVVNRENATGFRPTPSPHVAAPPHPAPAAHPAAAEPRKKK
jgi:hypothetical protein